MNTTLHAHVETYSVDCDGPMQDTYFINMRESEQESDFGDIEFHERVVGHVVNTYSIYMGGRLDVRKHADENVTLTWTESTEEGSRSIMARICPDPDCDTGETTHRDYYAEAMGY